MKKTLLCLSLALYTGSLLYSQNIYTVVGSGNQGFSGDGSLATSGFCELNQPEGAYVDKAGNIYIGDELNDVVRIVNTSGIINVFAGNHTLGLGYSGDGGQATDAQLNNPVGVCGDAAGNIYIADYGNNVIRKVNTSGIISTYAGTGIRGFSGDNGPATSAQLYWPVFIHMDIHGNLYIGDIGNNRIRKVNTAGIITTIAGNGKTGYSRDGGLADTTELFYASGAWADPEGNIYIADNGNYRVRKVNTSDIISTIAGNGTQGYNGDGIPATSAELYGPADICIDASGNILFTDANSVDSRLHKIDASGFISTIAGIGHDGYSGNGGPAIDAALNAPTGMYVDSLGNVYFSDQTNEVVRAISYHGPLGVNNVEDKISISIYPNPTTQFLTINFSENYSEPVTLTIMDITGREIINSQFIIHNSKLSVEVSSLNPGLYFVNISIDGQKYTRKFVKE